MLLSFVCRHLECWSELATYNYYVYYMAVPFIQIGQCGNQVGSAFYSMMHQEALKASPAHQSLLQQFFTEQQAKALLVDMEPKVVSRCLAKGGHWKYNPQLSLVRQQGSGNNWAYGCYVHGPKVKQDLENVLRKLVEPQDYINMFVQLQSMAGGTGSGLGTYILNLMDKIFPKTPKVVCCVMPHHSGQVILQAYNASLSLGSVYGLADGVFLIENDIMNKLCVDQLNIKKPQLQNINKQIARVLTSFFFPAVSHTVGEIHSIQQNALHYGRQLCEHVFFDNRYKLAGLKCAPYCQLGSEAFNGDSWQAIENQLFLRPKPFRSKIYVTRGMDATVGPHGIRTITDRHHLGGYNRSGVVVENGLSCAVNIQKIMQRAYSMLGQGAYIYQYRKFGLEGDQLEQCLATMQQIVNNYKMLK